MKELVRAELAKIGAAEEQSKINEHVKKEMERPPVAMKKVTQFLWAEGPNEGLVLPHPRAVPDRRGPGARRLPEGPGHREREA